MKTIIAGGRNITDPALLQSALSTCPWKITAVVSGCAKGVDTLGEEWAEKNLIHRHRFPADWNLGKAAGPIRNEQMAQHADALVAIWDGRSRGTAHMIHLMLYLGKPVHLLLVPEPIEHLHNDWIGHLSQS